MSNEQNCSREHLNRLLQQGLEIPIDEGKLTTDHSAGTFPEMPMCTVCQISVGETPVQAAQHYRSREHVNKRLQKGLPVAACPAGAGLADKDDTQQRDYINECLRLGVPNPYGLQTDSIVAPVLPKVSHGKRKFPVSSIGNAPLGTLAAPTSGFIHGKRACRPVSSMQTNISDFQSTNSLGMGFQGKSPHSQGAQVFRSPFVGGANAPRVTRPVAPSPNQWNVQVNAAPREPFYKDQFFGTGDQLKPVATTYTNQYQDPSGGLLYAAQQNASIYDDQQSGVLFGGASHNAMQYNENSGSSSFGQGWFCDLCNKALPTAAALNQHTSSAEHRMAAGWTSAPQSQVPSLFQQSW